MNDSVQPAGEMLQARDAAARKRLRQAFNALEQALSEGRSVSRELTRVSRLMEKHIDISHISINAEDLARLLDTARTIEAQHKAEKKSGPWRPSRRIPV